MSTPGSSTPPGWYPDEIDTLRWFDGRKWTEATRPVGPDAQSAYADAFGVTPPPGRGGSARRAVLAGLAVLVVVVVAGVIAFAVARSGGGATAATVPDSPIPLTGSQKPLPTASPTVPAIAPATPPAKPKPTRSPSAAVDPAVTVHRFFLAVRKGDCATFRRLVTPAYLKAQGGCTLRSRAPGALRGVTFTFGRPRITGSSATMSTTRITRAGGGGRTRTRSTFELKRSARVWLIRAIKTGR